MLVGSSQKTTYYLGLMAIHSTALSESLQVQSTPAHLSCQSLCVVMTSGYMNQARG